jgi:hypothetical protein
MTPIGAGVAVLALYLGFAGPRFWWKGAAVLLAVSWLFAIIVIAELHLTGEHKPLTGALIGRSVLFMPIYALVFYGVAAGMRWMARRLRKLAGSSNT